VTLESHDLPPVTRVVPVRRRSQWVFAAIIVAIIGLSASSLASNKLFQWDVVGSYLTDGTILRGLLRTLELTAIAMSVGLVLGVLVAVMRLSTNPVVRAVSWAFVWFFRGTPVLVQLIFWFNLSVVVQHLSISIPFGPTLWSGDTNQVVTPMVAAILGLGLNEGAFMSEIVRAGILSVDPGQVEAATSIGMTRLRTMRYVVLPQAIRVIIPPTGNETINMLKTTSLVSVITISELLYSAQTIYARTFETIPLLIVASIWYVVAVSVLSSIQYYIERHFARTRVQSLPMTPLQQTRVLMRRLSRTREATA
jgi:polar amino acid transport system permease protein